MSYSILEPDTKREISRNSSIKQYSSVFGGQRAGVWLPIVSDMIDYVECGRVVSHEVILTDNDEFIGYEYPVEKLEYCTNNLILSDWLEDTVEILPEWFGEGTYQKHASEETLTTSDTEALGETDKVELTIGLDYYLAKKRLPATE